MSSKSSLDTGVKTTPTVRTVVDKAAGMPAASPTTDAGVGTATAARQDVFSPQSGTYPPSAPSDPGDQ